MTRMVPNSVHGSHNSRAEERIFKIIQGAPRTEEWVCLHSLGIAHHPYKRRAEIDFLLITPEGIFVLEVKGGRVRRERGVWLYTNRHDETNRSNEGPVKQAESAMFALEKSLRKRFAGKKRLERVMLGFAVMFPDIEFPSTGIELDPRQVFDLRSRRVPFASFAEGLTQFTKEAQPSLRNGLRKEEIQEVVRFLQGDFDLIPSFAATAASTLEELTQLTEEQYAVLRADEDEERLLVHGAAGTGKSLLALEVARREARAGRSVLLLCYNQFLANHLAEKLRGEERVVVSTYHSQLAQAVRGSSVEAEAEDARRGANADRYFSESLPELAGYALLEVQRPRADVLILDEAQDILTPQFLDVISLLVEGGLEAGRWRIFLDRNTQARVYGNFDEASYRALRLASLALTLTTNCRNTTQIETATRLVASPTSSARSRYSGEPVERVWYRTDKDLFPALRKLLAQLRSEGVPPGDVTILFPRKLSEEQEASLVKFGVVRFGNAHASGSFTYAGASGFKGMENNVIVLAGVDELESAWSKAVAYVAMSRARVRLYLLLPENLKTLLLERFEKELLRQVQNEVS